MKSATVYLRGTTARYSSFSQQAEYIYEYVRRQRMRVVGDFRDVDAPGLKDRFALRDAIEEAIVSTVPYIVVQSPRILDEDPAVSEALVVSLARAGIEVLWAQEGINHTQFKDDPLRELLRNAADSSINIEKMLLPIRLRAARRLKGIRPGPRPYGYWPWEAETVKRIRQLRRKPRNQPRRSWREIAASMNDEGLRTRKGRRWTGASARAAYSRTT